MSGPSEPFRGLLGPGSRPSRWLARGRRAETNPGQAAGASSFSKVHEIQTPPETPFVGIWIMTSPPPLSVNGK